MPSFPTISEVWLRLLEAYGLCTRPTAERRPGFPARARKLCLREDNDVARGSLPGRPCECSCPAERSRPHGRRVSAGPMATPHPWRGRTAQLRGRRAELRMLDGLVEAVRAGESRALVVRGEPGVGKTALLDHLARRASGCRVVRAAGVQSEMELAFAGLHQLCAPMLDHLEAIPVPQRAAVRVAFGLGAGPVPDRFLVGLAVLGLLSEAAGERPRRPRSARRQVPTRRVWPMSCSTRSRGGLRRATRRLPRRWLRPSSWFSPWISAPTKPAAGSGSPAGESARSSPSSCGTPKPGMPWPLARPSSPAAQAPWCTCSSRSTTWPEPTWLLATWPRRR